jgi:chromosome segregation ATPase
MASMTTKGPKHLVTTYVERFEANTERKRAADAAARAEKERLADALQDEIRSKSELASQLKRTPMPMEASRADNEAINASSSSLPRRRRQDVAEIDGRAVPTSSNHHRNFELPPTQGQSRPTSLAATTNDRIQALESELASQNTRIHKLKEECDVLKQQVTDLQKRRDEAELALTDATAAGEAAKKEQKEIVEDLKQQIAHLMEERRNAERQIEELRDTVSELREQLREERQKVSRLEVEKEALERSDDSVAAPAVAASTINASSRRGSVGESERRRNGHGRRHSSGSSINILLQAKWGDDKEKKKKKGSCK